jgi:hypothetical protein
MLTKISSALDAIADNLEKKGLVKEAFEIDKVADTVEALYGVPGTPAHDIINRPYGPGWTPGHESKEIFTVDELESKDFEVGKEFKPVVVLDDHGKKLYNSQSLPGYGGWGNNSPTNFVVVNGKKAIFVDMGQVRGGTPVKDLKLKWAI